MGGSNTNRCYHLYGKNKNQKNKSENGILKSKNPTKVRESRNHEGPTEIRKPLQLRKPHGNPKTRQPPKTRKPYENLSTL
jgi:hypothetical protein